MKILRSSTFASSTSASRPLLRHLPYQVQTAGRCGEMIEVCGDQPVGFLRKGDIRAARARVPYRA
jgi:hypothetical protein